MVEKAKREQTKSRTNTKYPSSVANVCHNNGWPRL